MIDSSTNYDGIVTIPRGGVFGDFRKKRREAGWVKKSRMFEGIARVRDFSSSPPGIGRKDHVSRYPKVICANFTKEK